MGLSRDYNTARSAAYSRGQRRKTVLMFILWLIAILLLSLGITALIEGRGADDTAGEAPPVSGIASALLAPLPMQGASAEPVFSFAFGPRRQQTEYTVQNYNASVIRQPACGQVELTYFADAAFLGDSLTEGLTEYDINLGGALICGYRGIGPDTVLNVSTVKHSVRGEETVLEVLSAAQPKKLYILLGTNTLTTAGKEEGFLARYDKMLDVLRANLGPDCVIYVQSIPPVRPSARADRPGLATQNLRQVNEQLARMSAEKGCVYLDLWEALADPDGNLRANLAAPDGMHITAGNGYSAWIGYLRTHTRYAADSDWTPGSTYAAE